MFITTTDFIPGYMIVEIIDIARGSTVKTRHLGKDIGAMFQTIVGGEIEAYTTMMAGAREEAIARMEADAERMGANAIINVRFMTSAIMQGASEILAYGTAVRVEQINV